ncbi:MAG: DegT/DnrJ/EryC1/StrS family aminotransferase [Candidatus Limnocylindria bacterium]
MIPIARPQMGEEEKAQVWSALESGQLAQGQRVQQFEEMFAEFVGAPHAVATSSGTTAIHLALLGIGLEPDDEVIVPSFSFTATATPVVHAGGRPVFADVDPTYFTIDPTSIESLITPRTRAIIPVSLYGQPADMPAVAALADRHGLHVIEDACQAHGARLGATRSGAWGIGAFSFYPTKNMTTGEGGIITTHDAQVADRARLLREHGMRVRYRPEILGYNFRMTDIHASIGLAQLAKLPAANERRRAIAARYDAELVGVRTPSQRPGAVHVYHQYTLRVDQRDRFAELLAERGVGSNVYYPVPIHRQQPFIEMHPADRVLRVTDELTQEILSIPVYPTLTDAEVDTIISGVNGVAAELRTVAAVT